MVEGSLHSKAKRKAPDSLTSLERALLNDYQRGFLLVEQPYKQIAVDQRVSEEDVLEAYEDLLQAGMVSRIGAVVKPHRTGWSTLAAMAVPEGRLDSVAALVSSFPEVNHNYEREHRLNLWFVVTAADKQAVTGILEDIAQQTKLDVLDLPLEESFCIDLGFPLQW